VSRKWLVAGAAALLVGGAIALVAVWRPEGGHVERVESPRSVFTWPAEHAALVRLDEIALYRSVVKARALRSGRIDGDGILHVEFDLRAVVEPHLAAMGFPGGSELLPTSATGTITFERRSGIPQPGGLSESWSLSGPAPALDLLDRRPDVPSATTALDAIPGNPSALARMRLAAGCLADPQFGGAPLASWRDRVNLIESLLGRPLRVELAEDLAGPALFALYDGPEGDAPEAIAVAELRRSDRLASLLDMAFGLGALTERATVSRYRGVPTGSFGSRSGGTGIALAVDGPVIIVATSRARLESAIDARRDIVHPRSALAAAVDDDASWSAASTSRFVSRGWSHPARAANTETAEPIALTTATLRPEGPTGWRLEGHGSGPAITADPILPFLRAVLGRRQRGVD
jgi:hypothetical protein